MTQEKYKQQLTADQQRVLDDAALAILKIKSDTVAALTAVGGAGFSDNWFPIPCWDCSCPDFVGDFETDPNCQRMSPHCPHPASSHLPT